MKHLLLCVPLFFSCYIFGQQSINTSGGDVQSTQGSVAFSIGQVATTYIESGAIINEGVQQPYEFFEVLSISSPENKILLEVFPNPTKGIIYLKSQQITNATIEISDETGRIVFKEERKDVQSSQLNLTNLARGVYTIKVLKEPHVQLIKIIKN